MVLLISSDRKNVVSSTKSSSVAVLCSAMSEEEYCGDRNVTTVFSEENLVARSLSGDCSSYPSITKDQKGIVHFSGVSKVWSYDDIQDVDLTNLWYTQEEVNEFKATLVLDVKDLIKRRREIRSRIRRAHKATIDCCSTAIATVAETNTNAASAAIHVQDLEISKHMHDCIMAVGLEKFVDRNVYREKQRRRSMLLEAVDKMQNYSHMLNEDLRSTILRLACEGISAPSKMFAQYLGVAAAAVSISCDDNESSSHSNSKIPTRKSS